MSVWVVAEHRHRALREVTGELLAAAAALGSGPVTAVVLAGPGEAADLAASLAGTADAVLAVEHSNLGGFNGRAVAEALRRLAVERQPNLILGAHSAAGLDWAPTLAAGLRAPLVTDALEFTWAEGALCAVRAVYGGKLQARVRLPEAPVAVATLRPGTWTAQESRDIGPVEAAAAELPADLGKRFLEWVQEAAGDVDITQADVLVSVGRGIADPENLDVAEALAKALGATLSCSRPVVDAGWLPKERQVGISGKTVKPKIYLALGISGAFQHVTAMQGAALIVAVNKDPKAPIFRVAHYGIVGDLFKVVPALT
ncbi:MAG: electron transfer flavoprotein subunit alpha/FixB family protein, partial [Deferrisomatales bacterium]|nr:electron transfer flavoprotein subunit alpha/FixB family protein [Deferrisomatales bacterium]